MDNWIYCGDGKNMPEEHDTMHGKKSDEVHTTVEYENGKREVITLNTFNGKWVTDCFINFKVIAWMPNPEPYNLQ